MVAIPQQKSRARAAASAASRSSRDRVRRNEQEIRRQQRRVVERREVHVHHDGERSDDDQEPRWRASAPDGCQRDCGHGQHVQGERAVAVATGRARRSQARPATLPAHAGSSQRRRMPLSRRVLRGARRSCGEVDGSEDGARPSSGMRARTSKPCVSVAPPGVQLAAV